MARRLLIIAGLLYLLVAAWWVAMAGVVREQTQIELLNVANDPTRELWKEMNAAFIETYYRNTGETVTISMSHGGSGSQATSIINGLNADVAALGLWRDTDAVRKANLIDANWETRFPNRGLPFVSTIVMVVRSGNPKMIHDWKDLGRSDVKIVTPNPKTSGNGKWSFLAIWLALANEGQSEAEIEKFLLEMYRRVPVLDAGARGATMTFAQKQIGDVHLTWENEALSEMKEYPGQLEIIYPKISVQAEPHVAMVDANARKKKSTVVAEAYIRFLYSPEGQAIGIANGYRPTQQPVPGDRFPTMNLLAATSLGSWDDIQERYFADGAMFDRMLEAGRSR